MTRLTAEQRKALLLFERAALAAQPCPTNEDVAEVLDCSHTKAGVVVADLDALGLIRVTREGRTRTVEIVATGLRTAPTRRWQFINRTTYDRAERNPAAILQYHTGCAWCGCRVDVCSCRDGKAARGEMAA
ncbi:hypothetical protein [Croceicoccus sp. BE223]|uniref:hypothetical protein n=1 Tax=Croceicoccus sp. BE223 TaxID=2817716 RepID=UPI00285D4D89|nr:hypothetical protein [Croceicoccus sp. BE223]MDR7102973.1 hypothetical protein [Croceicoccus sp. BE223]